MRFSCCIIFLFVGGVIVSSCPGVGADDKSNVPQLDAAKFPDAVSHQVIFRQQANGYNNVRIPAICRTNAGTLLAFAEGREAGDAGDINIILRRSADNGKTWDKPIIVWNDGNNTCGNPTPVVDRETGVIWLFCTWNVGTDHENRIMDGTSEQPRKAFVCHSNDDGMSWSQPMEQPHLRKPDWGWYATGPCNAIQLERGPHQGRLVIPANHSVVSDQLQGPQRYRSHMIFSDDHGETWQLGALQAELTNESTVVELCDGSVMQNMRSYHGKGNRAVAVSRNGGETFGELFLDEALVSPVCQASLLRYAWPESSTDTTSANALEQDCGVLLFSAPHGTQRSQMSVWASTDDGKTWPHRKLIFDGPAAYSNLVALPNGQIGLLCELGNDNPYRTIVFVTFSPAWLME